MQRSDPPKNNFEALTEWLQVTTVESAAADVHLAKKILENTGSLILATVSMTPLEFATRILEKLKKLSEVMDESKKFEIHELTKKCELHISFLERHIKPASSKTRKKIADYEVASAIKLQAIRALLLTPGITKDAVSLFKNDLAVSGQSSKFALGVVNNALVWQANSVWQSIKSNLSSFENFAKKYPDNQLARLLEKDNKKFVESIRADRIALDGGLVILAIQRIIAEYGSLSRGDRVDVSKFFRESLESTFSCKVDALASEILKLELYARYCKENNLPVVAWIGSARPVFWMIDQMPGGGAYLNCDDSKWNLELNRTWLLAVATMGYEIKLVEQHFPSMEEAILSGDVSRFVVALANEIRAYFDSDSLKEKSMHSLYHGGTEPTATPQEILMLMSVGCKGHRNDDGTLSLVLPEQSSREYMGNDAVKLFAERPRRHSVAGIENAPPQPVKQGLFQYPGKSEEIRAALGDVGDKPNKKNK